MMTNGLLQRMLKIPRQSQDLMGMRTLLNEVIAHNPTGFETSLMTSAMNADSLDTGPEIAQRAKPEQEDSHSIVP